MFRTIFRNKLVFVLTLVMVCVSSMGTVAFATESDNSMQNVAIENQTTTNDDTVVNITVVDRSGTIVDSKQIPSAPVFGSTTLNLSSTANKIQFLGNKNGGGANTYITLTSPRLGLNGKSVAVNGSYQTIYTGSISGSVYIEWILSVGGVYNLVFVATD